MYASIAINELFTLFVGKLRYVCANLVRFVLIRKVKGKDGRRGDASNLKFRDGNQFS
jgi:hypothetical protein